jgi:hypothetical protein
MILVACDFGIVEGDRIVQADGTFEMS